MMKTSRIFLVLLAVGMLSACADDAANGSMYKPGGNPSVKGDEDVRGDDSDASGGESDANNMDPDVTGDGSDASSNDSDARGDNADARGDDSDANGDGSDTGCIPTQTQCLPLQCGSFDDGCGGTLDCGSCACQDGVVVVDGCGPCGLGQVVCSAGQYGAGSCVLPEIPGIDANIACEDDLIYVDAGASAGGDGSRTNPFDTYAAAAAAAAPGQTIILGGSEPFDEPLVVKDQVSVMGGFSGAPAFVWNPSARTAFQVPADPALANVFGLKAVDIADSTLIAQVQITTADGAPGQTNYGAYLVGASGLQLRDVQVHAGKGGSGAPGADGADGADGAAGENADDMQLTARLGTSKFSVPAGGLNSACPTANAGAGGNGKYTQPGTISPEEPGEPIEFLVNEPQGTTDAASPSNQAPSAGKNAASVLGAPRFGGQGGTVGTNHPFAHGGDGKNGIGFELLGPILRAPSHSGGSVVDDLWQPAGVGAHGNPGSHGTGGGGGGGADDGSTNRQLATELNMQLRDLPIAPEVLAAAPGGGGGAGGCGGNGGRGGEPGAGSFGLLAIDSDAQIADSTFQASAGGDGGSGGLGGTGGLGGAGGAGSARAYVKPQNANPTIATGPMRSGNGGSGADGSDGQGGVGGAGGVSYGAYCQQSTLHTSGQVEAHAGSPAQPGAPVGLDYDVSAPNPAIGITEDDHGCF